jgi:hypothetical protein
MNAFSLLTSALRVSCTVDNSTVEEAGCSLDLRLASRSTTAAVSVAATHQLTVIVSVAQVIPHYLLRSIQKSAGIYPFIET